MRGPCCKLTVLIPSSSQTWGQSLYLLQQGEPSARSCPKLCIHFYCFRPKKSHEEQRPLHGCQRVTKCKGKARLHGSIPYELSILLPGLCKQLEMLGPKEGSRESPKSARSTRQGHGHVGMSQQGDFVILEVFSNPHDSMRGQRWGWVGVGLDEFEDLFQAL